MDRCRESGKIVVAAPDDPLFPEAMKIYEAAFPDWEREPRERIEKLIAEGIYRLTLYLERDRAVGLAIVDLRPRLRYQLLTYLAVEEAFRGRGIGSRLCLDAIERFRRDPDYDWLFIEAQERQARLYAQLGFKPLAIDYVVPSYTSDETVPMSLMAIVKEGETLDGERLKRVVRDIFEFGYDLSPDDPRIAEQLRKIPPIVRFETLS